MTHHSLLSHDGSARDLAPSERYANIDTMLTKNASTNLEGTTRVPVALWPAVGAIVAITDSFCEERLDGEFGELCRRLIGCLARKRPSPLERGDARIWAAGTIYVVVR